MSGVIPVRLVENLRAVPYAPFYYALSGSYFANEGLAVTVITAPNTAETAMTLLRGEGDVAWGGPMRVLLHHDQDGDCPLVCFGQVVARDPFMLLGRTPNPSFRFADLDGLEVGVATDVPTPWLTFQDDLARAGVAPDSIRRGPMRTMAEAVDAFRGGALDVIQVFEPWADILVQEAGAHLWHRFSTRGDIAYTTFYATRRLASESADTCRRLVRGMARAQGDFHQAPLARIAERVQPYFPQLAVAALERMIGGYRQAALWSRTPDLPPAALLRLKAALVSGGLLKHDTPYDRVIDAALCTTA